jgi:hypothetical protein
MVSLSRSVGRGGTNRPQDVNGVQELVNKHIGARQNPRILAYIATFPYLAHIRTK